MWTQYRGVGTLSTLGELTLATKIPRRLFTLVARKLLGGGGGDYSPPSPHGSYTYAVDTQCALVV